MPIRAVVFDYAGVLGVAPFANTAAFEPGTVHDWHLLEVGQLDLASFMARTVERSPGYLGGATFDPLRYFEFMRQAPFGVHWMVVARARELHAAGYGTAILTNNVREWGDGWRATIPMDVFDVVVDSSEVGLRKPDSAIYLLTCERLGVKPDEAVFLDDNERNCEGARAVGLHAILVGPDIWSALAVLDTLL